MYKKIATVIAGLAVIIMPAIASAHVVVTPGTAKVGDYVLFSVSVPNEKDNDVTNLKLDVPTGLEDVTPTVKTGWTITTEKSGDSVTSITWAAGTIPAGQRDDFTFQAQVPAKATELDWKAYQTYADGTVVHWDQKPTAEDDDSGDAGPYSVTKVNNDIATTNTVDNAAKATSSNTLPVILGLVAVVISVGGILFRKK